MVRSATSVPGRPGRLGSTPYNWNGRTRPTSADSSRAAKAGAPIANWRQRFRSSLRERERRFVEEAGDCVARQARNRIVVVIMRQAGDEADRAGGEDGAALRRLEEDDVG